MFHSVALLSLMVVATTPPLGLNITQAVGLFPAGDFGQDESDFKVYLALPAAVSHIMVVVSSIHVAINFPSGLNARQYTVPPLPCNDMDCGIGCVPIIVKRDILTRLLPRQPHPFIVRFARTVWVHSTETDAYNSGSTASSSRAHICLGDVARSTRSPSRSAASSAASLAQRSRVMVRMDMSRR